jgi:phage-related protein
VPVINKFKDGWNVVSKAIDDNKENFQEFIFLLQTYVLPVLSKVFSFIIDMAAKTTSTIISVFGTIVGAITPTINFIIDAINKVITGLNYIKLGSDIGYISKIGESTSNFTYGGGNPAVSGSATVPTIPTTLNMGVPSIVSGGGTVPKTSAAKSAAQAAADMAVVATYGQTTDPGIFNYLGNPQAGVVNNITVNGAIDSESTARQIVDVLYKSYSRGGAVITTPFML